MRDWSHVRGEWSEAIEQGSKIGIGIEEPPCGGRWWAPFGNEGAPVWIKPDNRPGGRGKNKQTALTGVGNAPLLLPAAASPPEGEILAALCNK